MKLSRTLDNLYPVGVTTIRVKTLDTVLAEGTFSTPTSHPILSSEMIKVGDRVVIDGPDGEVLARVQHVISDKKFAYRLDNYIPEELEDFHNLFQTLPDLRT